MNDDAKLENDIHDEAVYIEQHSDFSYEDARQAVERSMKYYIDCGDDEERAWDRARELVGMAVYHARRNDFELLGMVDQMILSVFHRVQTGCGL